MTQKLIEHISMQIDEIFNGATIYTSHMKQNFEKNSFFIRIIKNSEKAYLANRFKLFNKIEIMYTPKNEQCTEEINHIKQILFEKMKRLKFEKGYIIGENMECEFKDKKLLFYIDYDFYIFRFNKSEKMQRLFSNGGNK